MSSEVITKLKDTNKSFKISFKEEAAESKVSRLTLSADFTRSYEESFEDEDDILIVDIDYGEENKGAEGTQGGCDSPESLSRSGSLSNSYSKQRPKFGLRRFKSVEEVISVSPKNRRAKQSLHKTISDYEVRYKGQRKESSSKLTYSADFTHSYEETFEDDNDLLIVDIDYNGSQGPKSSSEENILSMSDNFGSLNRNNGDSRLYKSHEDIRHARFKAKRGYEITFTDESLPDRKTRLSLSSDLSASGEEILSPLALDDLEVDADETAPIDGDVFDDDMINDSFITSTPQKIKPRVEDVQSALPGIEPRFISKNAKGKAASHGYQLNGGRSEAESERPVTILNLASNGEGEAHIKDDDAMNSLNHEPKHLEADSLIEEGGASRNGIGDIDRNLDSKAAGNSEETAAVSAKWLSKDVEGDSPFTLTRRDSTRFGCVDLNEIFIDDVSPSDMTREDHQQTRELSNGEGPEDADDDGECNLSARAKAYLYVTGDQQQADGKESVGSPKEASGNGLCDQASRSSTPSADVEINKHPDVILHRNGDVVIDDNVNNTVDSNAEMISQTNEEDIQKKYVQGDLFIGSYLARVETGGIEVVDEEKTSNEADGCEGFDESIVDNACENVAVANEVRPSPLECPSEDEGPLVEDNVDSFGINAQNAVAEEKSIDGEATDSSKPSLPEVEVERQDRSDDCNESNYSFADVDERLGEESEIGELGVKRVDEEDDGFKEEVEDDFQYGHVLTASLVRPEVFTNVGNEAREIIRTEELDLTDCKIVEENNDLPVRDKEGKQIEESGENSVGEEEPIDGNANELESHPAMHHGRFYQISIIKEGDANSNGVTLEQNVSGKKSRLKSFIRRFFSRKRPMREDIEEELKQKRNPCEVHYEGTICIFPWPEPDLDEEIGAFDDTSRTSYDVNHSAETTESETKCNPMEENENEAIFAKRVESEAYNKCFHVDHNCDCIRDATELSEGDGEGVIRLPFSLNKVYRMKSDYGEKHIRTETIRIFLQHERVVLI